MPKTTIYSHAKETLDKGNQKTSVELFHSGNISAGVVIPGYLKAPIS